MQQYARTEGIQDRIKTDVPRGLERKTGDYALPLFETTPPHLNPEEQRLYSACILFAVMGAYIAREAERLYRGQLRTARQYTASAGEKTGYQQQGKGKETLAQKAEKQYKQ